MIQNWGERSALAILAGDGEPAAGYDHGEKPEYDRRGHADRPEGAPVMKDVVHSEEDQGAEHRTKRADGEIETQRGRAALEQRRDYMDARDGSAKAET
jgi:hypothetical protein